MNLKKAKGVARANIENMFEGYDNLSKDECFSTLYQCAFLILNGNWPDKKFLKQKFDQLGVKKW